MQSPTCSFVNINLDNIIENYKIIQNNLRPGCEIAAVVKANAYGLGYKQITSTLYKHGCRKFCISSIHEASINFRESDTNDAKIYIMHGVTSISDAKIAAEHNFIPMLNDLEQIEIWTAVARKYQRKLHAVIQIDTGMGRFGLSDSDIKKFASKLELFSPYITIDYIMSHMSCAEQPNHPLTAVQLTAFKEYLAMFPNTKATFANSAGIFLGTDFQFDMVRPGCALYGINPTVSEHNPMLGVVELYGYIVQRRVIEHEQFIGYRAQYKAMPGEKLLVIECGYADGYVRSLSNKGICYAAGYFLPVVGIVSMDVIIVDASVLPENIFNSLTHVELLGENITIDDVARYANTISYEILTTRFGSRCQRFYKQSHIT